MPILASRRLVDWMPDAGAEDTWLARWAAAGWVPEYGYGVDVELTPGRHVTRWAMIRESALPAS